MIASYGNMQPTWWFLVELFVCLCACRYQNDDYSEPSGGPGPTQFDAFCRITDTFIKAGSREEVNLRYESSAARYSCRQHSARQLLLEPLICGTSLYGTIPVYLTIFPSNFHAERECSPTRVKKLEATISELRKLGIIHFSAKKLRATEYFFCSLINWELSISQSRNWDFFFLFAVNKLGIIYFSVKNLGVFFFFAVNQLGVKNFEVEKLGVTW